MKKILNLLLLIVIAFCAINTAKAYTHEVWQSGDQYYWKTYDVTQGNSPDLATAIQGAIGTGGRDVHILCGGTLSAQIELKPGLTLYCHNNTFNKDHSAYGFHIEGSGPIKIYNMTFYNNTNMGIRTSRAGDIYLENVKIYGGSIGVRIDSHPSRPYEDGRWVSNVHVQDCYFENCSSHGLETYGVDGFSGYGLVAKNCGECGVLLNKTINGSVGTVDAYRCCYGGGYAGFRCANSCGSITVNKVISNQCGRGIFILTGSYDITIKEAEVTDCTDIGIWFQDVSNCLVESGCCNCNYYASGTGSSINVGSSCISSTFYYIQNRATGLYLDGMGRTTNGSDCGQYANTTHINAQWALEDQGSNYYKIRNNGTGLYLDGMGRTTNGDICGQWAGSSHYNQQWERISTDGYYRFRNRSTGLYLDGMGYTSNGANVGMWANTSHVNSQWSLIDVSTTKSAMIDKKPDTATSGIKVYPTIVEDMLQIEFNADLEETATLNIYSSAGILVYSELLSNTKASVNLSELSKGVYFVQILIGESTFKNKIIKK